MMKNHSLHSIRRDYLQGELREENINKNPFNQFSIWFSQAMEKGDHDPTAMTLATVDQSGCPSARIVLLKQFSEQGFDFYTNHESKKGKDISLNNNVALLFYWSGLERQVRITGQAERLSTIEADEYFLSRPIGHQLASHASQQSKVIPNREYLVDRLSAFKKKYSLEEMKRPENWGGYRVVPRSIEFWQGGSARLHDRIKYTLEDKVWVIERLAP